MQNVSSIVSTISDGKRIFHVETLKSRSGTEESIQDRHTGNMQKATTPLYPLEFCLPRLPNARAPQARFIATTYRTQTSTLVIHSFAPHGSFVVHVTFV